MSDSRFGALRELRRAASLALPAATAPETAFTSKPFEPIKTTARQLGKSSRAEFERMTVYVRKTTKKAAGRKWEDATGQDMSDLVEHLLTEYLGT